MEFTEHVSSMNYKGSSVFRDEFPVRLIVTGLRRVKDGLGERFVSSMEDQSSNYTPTNRVPSIVPDGPRLRVSRDHVLVIP